MKENKRKNNLKAKINNRTEVNKKEERTFDDRSFYNQITLRRKILA